MRFLGGKQRIICRVASSLFFQQGDKFSSKRRIKRGWVQAEDLRMIILFFENIVKNILENPWNLAENPLENPGQEVHFTAGTFIQRYPHNQKLGSM